MLTCPCPARTQDVEPQVRDLPVSQWLAEADRHDIPWKVTFSPAHLTFDQRHLLRVRVRVDANALQKASVHRDLYMVLRAADASGAWLHDANITHFEITQALDRGKDLQFDASIFVRPGRHLLALILYDSVLGQRSVMRRWVRVEEMRNDPLPALERGPDEVEFLPAPGPAPPDALAATALAAPGMESHDGTRMGRRLPSGAKAPLPRAPTSLPVDSSMADGPSSEPEARRRVVIRTARPIEIDVLVDFTPSWQFAGAAAAYRRTASVFQQVTHVLSLLQPERGCVRLTGIDVLGQRVLFEGMEGDHVEWGKVNAAIAALDPNTVDVQSLQGRTRMAEFFRGQVSRMLQQPANSCLAGDTRQPPLRVYVIAASGIVFPNGSQRALVDPMPGSEVRMYYLRAALARDAVWDEMAKIVKPLHPRLLTIDTPLEFRKALATMVSDLEHDPSRP